MDDPLFKDLFELAELCNYYVHYGIRKQMKSALEESKFGKIVEGMDLKSLVSF